MCMYKGTPRSDWHVLCALVLSRINCILFWILIFVLLYCSVCISVCIFHSHLYILLPFNVLADTLAAHEDVTPVVITPHPFQKMEDAFD